jgi:hypothetical protein
MSMFIDAIASAISRASDGFANLSHLSDLLDWRACA